MIVSKPSGYFSDADHVHQEFIEFLKCGLLEHGFLRIRCASCHHEKLVAYQGKITAILAASPGALGGLRGLVFLRMLLANIGVTVLPEQQAIPQAYKAFNDDDSLIDDRKHKAVLDIGRKLAYTVGKLND